MNAIIDNIETKIETEVKETVAEVKLEYNKVMAILRAHFGGDHPVISDVKKLVGETPSPELAQSISVTAVNDTLPSSNFSSVDAVTDPKPVDTTVLTGTCNTVSG